MKKNSAKEFYLKICIWTFSGLILASAYSSLRYLIGSHNESAAVRTIDTIVRLQNQYSPKKRGNFAPNFHELVKVENLDAKFLKEHPVIDGYVFALNVSETDDGQRTFFSITADPLYPEDNLKHFYYDSTLESVRATEEDRPANANDPSI